MPVLASGNSTSLTLGTYDSITLQNRAGQSASLTIAGVLVNGAHSGTRTYGPYPAGGAVSITATAGDVYYETADGRGFTKPVEYTEEGPSLSGAAADAVVAGARGMPLAKWSKALAGARAGVGQAKVLCVGPSTVAGDGSNATTNGLRSLSYPAFLARILAAKTGLPVSLASTFGAAGKADLATLSGFEPRLGFLGSWAVSTAEALGGRMIVDETGTGAYSFTVTEVFDRIEIGYFQKSGGGTFTVDNGGATLATINSGSPATGALIKTTVNTGGAAAAGTVNIKRVSGRVDISWIRLYSSTQFGIEVGNAGWSASRADQWAGVGSVFSPIPGIGSFAPDLTIIDLGINDWNQGLPVASADVGLSAYITNMQTIINAAAVSGDVILVSSVQSNPANFATLERQRLFIDAVRQLAVTNNLNYLSSVKAIGEYSAAAASGYMFDDRHPRALGYARLANPLAETILSTAL